MPILAKPFPEYGVILQVFRGVITREDWLAYYEAFAAAHARFVSWIDPSADLSRLDLASAPELKRLVAGKLREHFGEEPVVSILVASSDAQAPYLKFWKSFEAAGDEGHPTGSVIVASFGAAAKLLDLPDDAGAKLAKAAVEA